MKSEKALKAVGIMSILIAIMAFTINSFIMAFVMFVVGVGILVTGVGTGSFNERNLYIKKIENTDITIDELYELFKDMETPVGRCFIADFREYGRSLIFGPHAFKDMVVISKRNGNLELRDSDDIASVKRTEENAKYIDRAKDTKAIEVTPKSYTWFAAYKVMTAVLLDDLTDLIQKYVAGENPEIPKEIDMFDFFRFSTATNVMHDENDNEILEGYPKRRPVCSIELKSVEDGSELATIVAQDPNAIDITTAVFDIVTAGEKYGTIYHEPHDKVDAYRIETPDGEFVAEAFQAVRRANIGSNYIIKKDGERKAVVFGSPRIELDGVGYIEIDGVCSYDNEYIVLYMAFEMFLMNSRRYLK